MRQQLRREQKRQMIKDAALQLFATKGYENTKVADIVKHIQSSQGTFYWYFESKEQCALQLIEDGGKELLTTIRAGYRVESFEVAQAFMSTKNIFWRIFEFAQNNRFLMQIILRGIHTQPALQQKVDEIKTAMEQAFEQNLLRAKELGVLREDVDERFQAILIMSLIEGVLSRWLAQTAAEGEEQPFTDVAIRRLIDQTAHFEFYGLFGLPNSPAS